MNNLTRKKLLMASLPLLLIVTALIAGFIFFPESFDLRNKASTGTTNIAPRPTGTEAMLMLQESADRNNVVQSFDLFLNTSYKPDAQVSSFKTTILVNSQNGMVLGDDTTIAQAIESEPVQTILTPRTVSTTLCYMNVGESNGQYTWRGCKTGTGACAAVVTALTETELAGYKEWIASGRPAIAGCPTPTPTNIVTPATDPTVTPTTISDVVVFEEGFLKVTTLAAVQNLFDLSVTTSKPANGNGTTILITISGTLKPGVSPTEVQKQNLKVATVKYDTQRYSRTVSARIQERSVMGTTASNPAVVELITTPTQKVAITSSVTPTISRGTVVVPSCNARCSTNSNCAGGLACINGMCKNPACTTSSTCQCNPVTPGDTSCVVAGCSGELCVEAGKAGGIASTCQYSPEYACLKRTTCGRNAQGQCQWDRTTIEYNQCINTLPKTTITLNPSIVPSRPVTVTKTPTPSRGITVTPTPCAPAPYCDGYLMTGMPSDGGTCPVYQCIPTPTPCAPKPTTCNGTIQMTNPGGAACPSYQCIPTPTPTSTCPWYNPFCGRSTPTPTPYSTPPARVISGTPGAAVMENTGQIENFATDPTISPTPYDVVLTPTPFDQVVVPPTPTPSTAVVCQWWNIACRTRNINRRATPTPSRRPITPSPTRSFDNTVGCSALYSPVCTSTNRTYSNACEAQKAGAIIVRSGVCFRQ